MIRKLSTIVMETMTSINKTQTKTKVNYFGFFILYCFLFFGCATKELTARQIVEKSVEVHGSIDSWRNVKELSFDKETTLFLEDGSVEEKTDQFQLFRLQPSLFGKIEWEDDNNDVVVIYDSEKTSKTINDSVISSSDELEKAKNSFFAAQYVIVQPFALLDEGVELALKGQVDLGDKKAYEIGVKYVNDTDTSNKWSYFFDTESFEVIANKVELSDHTSWVDNLTFDTTSEFIFNAHRKSYRLNKAGEKTYLRAEYNYSNYKVIFK